MSALTRVRAYLAAHFERSGRNGSLTDPVFIHSIGTIGGTYDLKSTDLNELVVRLDALEAFLSDFAAHDFTDATKGWPRHPDDEEPMPLTDAHAVWDMQKEARELLKGGK